MSSRITESSSPESGGNALRQPLEFAGFRLDPGRRQLNAADGTPVSLNSRAFDTLLALVARRGEILSKQELLETVWPRVIVEENNLNQAISALRKALGDNQDRHRIILTVPGRGYCFVAEVRPVGEVVQTTTPPVTGSVDGSAAAVVRPPVAHARTYKIGLFTAAAMMLAASLAWVALKQPPVPAILLPADDTTVDRPVAVAVPLPVTTAGLLPNSVAILPFAMKGTGPEYLALGLYQDVYNQLDRLSRLNVISPGTMMRYRLADTEPTQLASELAVATLLKGEVSTDGTSVHIEVKLSNPHAGKLLWSSRYDAALDDTAQLFKLEGDIVTQVATMLGAAPLPSEQRLVGKIATTSAAAFQQQLQAGTSIVRGDLVQALTHLAQAVAFDPEYVDAWNGLSQIHTLKTAMPLTTSGDHYEQSMWAAQQALQRDSMNPASHVAMASALFNAGSWDQASAEYKQARQYGARIDKSNVHALFLLSRGDFAGAKGVLETALQTDPVNYFDLGFLMLTEELLGERDAARQRYARREQLYPGMWSDAVGVALALGRDDREFLARATAEYTDYSLYEVLQHYNSPQRALAELLRLHDNIEQVAPGRLLQASMFAAWLDQRELALDFLRIGLRENWMRFYLLWLPVFDDLRTTAEFRQFLLESGVVDFWQAAGWPRVCSPVGTDDFACNWRSQAQ